MRIWLLCAALMMGAPLSAQTAQYKYLNQPGYNPQFLTALSRPVLGTTFQVEVMNGFSLWTPSPYFYLAIGASNPGVQLPGVTGLLFTSADVVVPVPVTWPSGGGWPSGLTTMSFPIPNSPQLAGMEFFVQVLGVFQGEFVPPSYTLSRGLHCLIGR